MRVSESKVMVRASESEAPRTRAEAVCTELMLNIITQQKEEIREEGINILRKKIWGSNGVIAGLGNSIWCSQ